MKIFVNENIINNLDLNNYDIATYVALRCLYFNRNDEFYISVDMLTYQLYGLHVPERVSAHIKQSISNLAELGLYDIIATINHSSGGYIIKEKKLYLSPNSKKNNFTVIFSEDIQKIMALKTKRSRVAILRFFINVISTINRGQGVYLDFDAKQNFVGYMSQTYIGSLSGINVGVVEDYFHLLEKEQILYVYRHRKALMLGNQFKTLTNHYGRYEDKDYIEQFALAYEKTLNVNSLANMSNQSNTKRALMAKYNYIVLNPEKYINKYSDDELIEIYKYIVQRNDKAESMEKGDVKDTSVFDGLKCIKRYKEKMKDELWTVNVKNNMCDVDLGIEVEK